MIVSLPRPLGPQLSAIPVPACTEPRLRGDFRLFRCLRLAAIRTLVTAL